LGGNPSPFKPLVFLNRKTTKPWDPWVLSNEVRGIPISTKSVDLWGEDINTELSENIYKQGIEMFLVKQLKA